MDTLRWLPGEKSCRDYIYLGFKGGNPVLHRLGKRDWEDRKIGARIILFYHDVNKD